MAIVRVRHGGYSAARVCAELIVTIFRPGLPQNLHRGRGENSGHQRGDAEVGPRGSGSPHARRRDHHHHVADRVVARTQPDRAHVGVAVLVAHQHQHRGQIGRQRQHGDYAHQFGARQAEDDRVVDRRSHHPERHQAQRQAFEQGRRGAGSERGPNHRQAQPIGDGIGEEIQSVGFESLRPGEVARDHLREKHRAVNANHRPEHAFVSRIESIEAGHAAVTAACGVRVAACRRDGLPRRWIRKLQRRRGAAAVAWVRAVVGHGRSFSEFDAERTTSSD